MKYFGRLLVCLVLSITSLAIGLLGPPSSAFFWIAAALLPLVYYHLVFLRPRVVTATDGAAVDSVYYFGFLLTVAALALTAISIANGSPNMGHVVLNFGLGLFATGYAVIARMHLLSLSHVNLPGSPEEIMDKYVRRSQELVDNVESATTRVIAFADEIVRKKREEDATNTAKITEELLSAARAFETELSSTLQKARAGVGELQVLFRETALSEERQELAAAAKASVNAMKNLGKNTASLVERVEEGAASFSRLAASIGHVESSIQGLGVRASELAGADGPLSSASDRLQALSRTWGDSLSAAQSALKTLEGLDEQLTQSRGVFEGMREVAQNAKEQFNALSAAAPVFHAAVSQFSASAEAASGIARDIASVQLALPKLGVSADLLTAELEELKNSASKVATEIAADAQRSAESSRMLTTSLIEVADTIIRETRSRESSF